VSFGGPPYAGFARGAVALGEGDTDGVGISRGAAPYSVAGAPGSSGPPSSIGFGAGSLSFVDEVCDAVVFVFGGSFVIVGGSSLHPATVIAAASAIAPARESESVGKGAGLRARIESLTSARQNGQRGSSTRT